MALGCCVGSGRPLARGLSRALAGDSTGGFVVFGTPTSPHGARRHWYGGFSYPLSVRESKNGSRVSGRAAASRSGGPQNQSLTRLVRPPAGCGPVPSDTQTEGSASIAVLKSWACGRRFVGTFLPQARSQRGRNELDELQPAAGGGSGQAAGAGLQLPALSGSACALRGWRLRRQRARPAILTNRATRFPGLIAALRLRVPPPETVRNLSLPPPRKPATRELRRPRQ